MNDLMLTLTPNEIEQSRATIHQKYLEFARDSLQNQILKCFVFDKDKDLQKGGKRKKYLGKIYEFNDLDLMKEIPFSGILYEIKAVEFINTMFKPRTSEQFRMRALAINSEVNYTLVHLRSMLHRRYGLRLYAPLLYYKKGYTVKQWCLVPTDPIAIENFKKHKQYSKNGLLILENRVFLITRMITGLKDKLGTFVKELKTVTSEIKITKESEGW